MTAYLACIKRVKGVNEDQCRELAKSYLTCRMDRCVTLLSTTDALWIRMADRVWLTELTRNLMAKDEMKNLGFAEDDKKPETGGSKGGVKGELIW